MSSLLTAGWWASNRGYIYRGKRILGWSTQRRYIHRDDVIMMSFITHSSHTHTRTHTHSLPTAKYISVVLLLLCAIAGDIIVQIDRQDLSHMTLAQATLALGTSSPLIKLGVYRPSAEDSTFVQLLPRITHTHRVSVYMCTYWRANSVVCTVEPLIRAPSEIGTTSLQMTLVSIPC